MKIEGVLLRQAQNVYAINENIEVHFLVSGGHGVDCCVHWRAISRRPVSCQLIRVAEQSLCSGILFRNR